MKRSRILLILAILFLTAFFAVELLYFLVIKPEVTEAVAMQQSFVSSGTQINGINVSGLTKEQVQDTVKKMKEKWEQRKLTVTINDRDYSFVCKDFGIYFPEEAHILESLFSGSRDRSIWEQYAIIKGLLKAEPVNYLLEPACPEGAAKEIAARLAEVSLRVKRSPKLTVSKGNINFLPGQDGFQADPEELEAVLEAAVKELLTGDDKERHIVFEGVVTPLSEKERLLEEIDTCVATFSTEYIESSKKGNNVRIATKRLDGLLLYPGESASVDTLILDRTRANGYLHAPIFVNGHLVEGMGGGVCQVSSTLYGALLRASILPDERYPHSMVPPYIPMGLDAAIYQNQKDLKFTNTLDYPIYIAGSAKKGVLTFEIWSNKDALEGYTYVPYAKKISANRAKSFLKKYLGDTLIETIELYTDWYRT